MWTDPRRAIQRETLERMTRVLRHRGPDDEGFYTSDLAVQPPRGMRPGVALGFRRLAIIDLITGAQPMSNEDGSVWVVFNGEIYNYPALRKRLEGTGHTFRTQSDTETIVHLYEDLGPDCFPHLNGMFAIAIWDQRRGRLVLGRDRLGQKPLVYRHEPGRLLFASELKSLLQVPDVPRELDPAAIDEYLTYQYVPHPNTIFRGIRKLPPGHCAVYEDGRLTVRSYWQPDFNAERPLSVDEATEQLRPLLASAVQMRMRSDVPLGAFLSGGIDSSLIVALMCRHASQPVRTFSIGFPVKQYDETSFARCVAQHLGTEHHEFQVVPDCVHILPKLVWHYDEPMADSSAIPTWYVSQMTRQHVTVALSGDGGDELFCGYDRYRAIWLAHQLDRLPPLRRLLAAPLWQQLPDDGVQKSIMRRWKRFSRALELPPQRRYLQWIAVFDELDRAALYSDDFLAQLPDSDPIGFLRTAWQRAQQRDPLTAVAITDLLTYLPCDLMTKVDIASMAHSLECRQPFLDYRVVEWAASLPLACKFRWGVGKRVLRRAFADLLPQRIWRRRKMGFGVPLGHWFRHELRSITHDVLLDPHARTRCLFRPAAVRALVRQHEARTHDHSHRLWALLFLELWMRQWLQQPAGCREKS